MNKKLLIKAAFALDNTNQSAPQGLSAGTSRQQPADSPAFLIKAAFGLGWLKNLFARGGKEIAEEAPDIAATAAKATAKRVPKLIYKGRVLNRPTKAIVPDAARAAAAAGKTVPKMRVAGQAAQTAAQPATQVAGQAAKGPGFVSRMWHSPTATFGVKIPTLGTLSYLAINGMTGPPGTSASDPFKNIAKRVGLMSPTPREILGQDKSHLAMAEGIMERLAPYNMRPDWGMEYPRYVRRENVPFSGEQLSAYEAYETKMLEALAKIYAGSKDQGIFAEKPTYPPFSSIPEAQRELWLGEDYPYYNDYMLKGKPDATVPDEVVQVLQKALPSAAARYQWAQQAGLTNDIK